MGIDTLAWILARGRQTARVTETGEVEGDAELVEFLRRRLSEPVTVWRQGTVAPVGGGPEAAAVQISPGDGRFVVACIRRLCAAGECEVVETAWG